MSERLEILGVGVDRVTSDEALERIGTFIAEAAQRKSSATLVST